VGLVYLTVIFKAAKFKISNCWTFFIEYCLLEINRCKYPILNNQCSIFKNVWYKVHNGFRRGQKRFLSELCASYLSLREIFLLECFTQRTQRFSQRAQKSLSELRAPFPSLREILPFSFKNFHTKDAKVFAEDAKEF